jgi:hypothetical protein
MMISNKQPSRPPMIQGFFDFGACPCGIPDGE